MTGAYRDSLKKTPAFSIDSVLSEPATSSASHGPVASAPAAPAAPARTAASQSLAASSEFRQLFGQSSAAPATVTAAVTTPAVVTPRAAEAQQPEASFVPSFRAATGATPVYDAWSLNRTYFASPQTAQWIANKYGTGEVVEVPFGGAGGIFTASANEYHIKLKDGRLVNAGILAGYYERNPPEKFPGLADKLIKGTLGLV